MGSISSSQARVHPVPTYQYNPNPASNYHYHINTPANSDYANRMYRIKQGINAHQHVCNALHRAGTDCPGNQYDAWKKGMSMNLFTPREADAYRQAGRFGNGGKHNW
jgi:hypothetical protein